MIKASILQEDIILNIYEPKITEQSVRDILNTVEGSNVYVNEVPKGERRQ